MKDVCLAAADCLFEEVTPAALLDDRPCENGTRDFLVQWSDGAEDSWVRPGFCFAHRRLTSAAESFACIAKHLCSRICRVPAP